MGPGGSMLEQPKSLEFKGDLYAELPNGNILSRLSSTFQSEITMLELDTKKGIFTLTRDELTLKQFLNSVDRLVDAVDLIGEAGVTPTLDNIYIVPGEISSPKSGIWQIDKKIKLYWGKDAEQARKVSAPVASSEKVKVEQPAESIRADEFWVAMQENGDFTGTPQKKFEKGSSTFRVEIIGDKAKIEFINDERNLIEIIGMPETLIGPVYDEKNRTTFFDKDDSSKTKAIRAFHTVKNPKYERMNGGWKLIEKGIGAWSSREDKIEPPVEMNVSDLEKKETPQPEAEEIIEKTSAPVFAPQPIAPASLENEFDALEYFDPKKIEELASPMLVGNRRVQYTYTSAPGPQINVRILIDQEPEIVEFLITKSEVEQAQSEKDILATLKKRIPLINSIVEMMLSGEGQKLDKDQEENPFKFFLARRIGMRSQNLYFPKTHEAYIPNLEELNTAMGQGNETGKYVIYFQTEENELEATKVVAFTTNGLFLQIENFDEVRQNGRINVNDKKARFAILSSDQMNEGSFYGLGGANSLGEAQSLLQQEAEKLIEFQLDEFYNEVETSKLNLMQSTGGTQGEKETYLREKEKERIFDVGLVSIDRANLKQKITESANNKPHQEYYQNLLAELEKDPLEFYKKLAQEQRQPVHQRVVQIIENIKSNYQRKVEGLN